MKERGQETSPPPEWARQDAGGAGARPSPYVSGNSRTHSASMSRARVRTSPVVASFQGSSSSGVSSSR